MGPLDTITKDEWIGHLNLTRHIDEGGYYSRQYISDRFQLANGRCAMDTIYYMLTDDSPIGHLHRNESDIVHFFHAGSALYYTTIDPAGGVDGFWLGPNPRLGHRLQQVVLAGWWKATELREGPYGLLSEAVSPSFLSTGRTVARRTELEREFSHLTPQVLRLAFE